MASMLEMILTTLNLERLNNAKAQRRGDAKKKLQAMRRNIQAEKEIIRAPFICLRAKADARGRGGHFVGARLIGGSVGRAVVLGDQVIGQHIGLDFFAADVGEHFAVDFHAGTEHLPGFLDHFLALHGIVDDVAILVREVVFAQDGADSLAPAAGGFEIGNDLGLFHKFFQTG
jgi:hypothetical protein